MSRAIPLLVLVLSSISFGLVSPQLEEHLRSAASSQLLPVHVVLKEQFDARQLNALVDGMPKPERRMAVARILGEFSSARQAGMLEYLAGAAGQGAAADVRPIWIVNAVYCEATPEVIRELAARPEVEYVDYDLQYSPDLLGWAEPREDGGEEITYGVEKINAPAVWALGYTGAGIVCGHIDTGCNYNHVDLADHMWTDPNYPKYGWNFESNTNDPNDNNGHGTHTAGTVASDGTGGTQCGVAPDAQMMICRVRTTADSVAEAQCWQAIQFCLSPPLSPANGADLYTMSLGWQISWNPKQATWRTTANNVNAAGLIQVVAAGNERSLSPPNSCRCPGNVPPPWWNPQNTGVGALSGIMSIGATDANDNYASFSSRGPVTWQTVAGYNDYAYPPGLTRPDMAAPGVNTKSCARTGGYTTMSGTSMATPHTAGAVCLMLSKNANLSPAVVDSILEITAVDRGPAGKDNDYGAGRIDVLAAVNWIGGSGGPMLALMATTVHDSAPGGNNNGQLDPGETAKLLMALRNTGGAACNNTAGVLRSGDARVVVTDADGTWGNIPPGGTATNDADKFAVQANSGIPPGTSVPCTLHVTGDSADYARTFVLSLVIGVPPTPPGTIIWGPRTAPGMPTAYGLYGLAYNTTDDKIYCTYFTSTTIYKYSSDSMLTAAGTVTAPEDSCTDLHYCAYDNTFWLLANPSKKVYKMTPTGTVIRSFNVPWTTYPVGIAEHEAEHKLYISDRRMLGQYPQYIFRTDTLGNLLDTITHPLRGPYGTRCLSFDVGNPTNPPSLLNMYTWFNTAGTALESCCVYEMERPTGAILNGMKFTNTNWNMRGVEYDPRDGSYWLTIMQDNTGGNNRILKVTGFSLPVGVEEPGPGLRRSSAVTLRAIPNPFLATTRFEVELASPGPVSLCIYDNTGRLVRVLAHERPVSGRQGFAWDGRDDAGALLARGIYFCRLNAADEDHWLKTVFYR